jgi:aspartyl-tRNA(Asn)/glutamyl-tRNA(Gln) amidotransferase subunit A
VTMLPSLAELAADLESGARSARGLAEACLEAAASGDGEGARVFTLLDPTRTQAEAEASHLLRSHGVVPSPLAGLPLSIKDLFDVVGQVTIAASRAMAGAAPAKQDAPPVQRLRAAGAVFIGRTNMTEFAYSGLGLNPHFGTPANPHDKATPRIPGGSTSGGAVSVATGMAAAAIGTDTGGSCRIPAAMCGLVGFKPTAGRIPLKGCIPLSPSLDSVGAIGRSVACVALLDAIMAGEPVRALRPRPVEGLRILVPSNYVMEDMDEAVAMAFSSALDRLSTADAHVVERPVPLLDRLPELVERGGISGAEAYAWHKELLAARAGEYDPRVRVRIAMGEGLSAADYQMFLAKRAELIALAEADFDDYDLIAMPQVPIVAPPFSAVEDDAEYARLNRLVLRNPSVANLLDRCGVSLPCPDAGALPVGLGLVGRTDGDVALLSIAAGIENVLTETSKVAGR